MRSLPDCSTEADYNTGSIVLCLMHAGKYSGWSSTSLVSRLIGCFAAELGGYILYPQ